MPLHIEDAERLEMTELEKRTIISALRLWQSMYSGESHKSAEKIKCESDCPWHQIFRDLLKQSTDNWKDIALSTTDINVLIYKLQTRQ